MKNKIRILLTILTIFTIFCNTIAFASVNPTAVIDKCLIDDTYNLVVEARVPGALKRQNLGILCQGPDGEFVFADQTTLTERNEDSELVADFYSVKFQPWFKSGEYKITVSGKGIDPDTETISYYGVDSWSTALNAIVDADGSAILTAAKQSAGEGVTNADMIGIDISALESFVSTSEFYAIVDKEDADFSLEGLDPTNDEDALAIQEIVISFKKLWSDALCVGEYYNADTAEEVKSWFAKNQKVYDDNPTVENMRFDFNGDKAPASGNADRDAYLKESYVLNNALASMMSADKEDNGARVSSLYSALASEKPEFSVNASGNTWDEATVVNAAIYAITNQLRDEIVLKTVQYMNSEYLGDILTNASGVINIDYTKFGALSDKSQLYSGIVGKDYASLADLENAINTKLGELGVGTGGGDYDDEESSGTPSKPGKGTIGISGGSAPSKPNDAVVAGGKYFSDVPANHWAEGAINALYEKGVINGKDAGVFDPEGNVTRSEFVKMLICAFGFSTDGIECEFADLNSAMWQYPYVAAASELEIVMGLGDGRFGINDVITRQDMAVITERAMRVYGEIITEGTAHFGDIDYISDYAVSSVKTLAALGIINGIPDGNFAPMQSVSRAQAASIIYRAINN